MSLSICNDKRSSLGFQELQFKPELAPVSIPSFNLENPGQTLKRKKVVHLEVFESDLQKDVLDSTQVKKAKPGTENFEGSVEPNKSQAVVASFSENLNEKRAYIKSDPGFSLLARNLRVCPDIGSESEINYVLKIGKILFTIRNSIDAYKKYGSKDENRFIDRSKTGLERSLQIDADGSVWLLLNRERDGDRLLGAGGYKSIKRVVNVETLEVCARAEFFDVGEAEQEMRMANLCGARVEGVVKMYSSIFYTNKTGEERAALILKEYTRDLAVELDRYSVNKFSRIEIAIGVLTGLKNLHELNVCHYDIRPDNILVDRDGLKTEAVLTDLNLSSEIGAPVHPQGPDEYRPPEIRKLPNEEETLPVTPAMDIYSLGQTFKKLIKFPTILVGEALKLMMDEEPKNRPSSQDLLNLFTHEKRAQILCSAIKSSKKWKTIQTTSSSK